MRLYFVVPAGFDDPARPSGGNGYDRRVADALADLGWTVDVVALPGPWPRLAGTADPALSDGFGVIPDGSLVLVDGLLASGMAELLVPRSSRLRLGILVHTLLAGSGIATVPAGIEASEAAVLAAAGVVVTTSAWTRDRLLARYPVPADRVRVVRPGVAAAAVAPGTAHGGALLCVANLVPHKGQDVLAAALAEIAELDWRCVCVGALDQDAGFVAGVRTQLRAARLADRVEFTGVLDGAALDRAYAAADLVVVASRSESYGMVVIEALAHGLPVLGAAVGGVPEALGHAGGGRRPGRLVAPDDPAALAAALRAWLADADERGRLRAAARDRRQTLPDWPAVARNLSAALKPLMQ